MIMKMTIYAYMHSLLARTHDCMCLSCGKLFERKREREFSEKKEKRGE